MSGQTREGYLASLAVAEDKKKLTYLTNRAIRSGAIQSRHGQPCNDCGRTATDNEHRDYTKWWEIEPCCRPCNFKRGRGAPYKHIPHNTTADVQKFIKKHEQCMGQFAASMFHVNDEECADLVILAERLAETSKAVE